MAPQWVAQWKVNSFTTDKIYTVSVAKTGRWACDCPAHRFARAPKEPCKHIKKVRNVQEVPVASAVPAQVQMNNLAARHVGMKGVVKNPVLVTQTPFMLVIQTRREVCLEED